MILGQKSVPRKSLIFLVLTVFCMLPFSRGGIRTVGNGGGFAEVQFVYYFYHTAVILNTCLSRPELCKLKPEQIDEWQKLRPKVPLLTANYSVNFDSTLSVPWILDKQTIVIPNQALYDSKDFPLSQYRILAYSIAVQISMTSESTIDFQKVLHRTEESLMGFAFNSRSHELSTGNGGLFFHEIKIGIAPDQLNLYSLEDSGHTYVLNQIIEQSYPDLEINSLQTIQVTSLVESDHSGYYGFINGRLKNGQAFSGKRFALTFNLDANGKIRSETVRLQISQ